MYLLNDLGKLGPILQLGLQLCVISHDMYI